MRARFFALIAAVAILASVFPVLAEAPPDIVELERQVSLELAHMRDSGPTDPVKRQELYDASQSVDQGEAAIKSGDYKSAESHLLHAREILLKLR
jgi:hypothetical protein